jgi:hypothetical protein
VAPDPFLVAQALQAVVATVLLQGCKPGAVDPFPGLDQAADLAGGHRADPGAALLLQGCRPEDLPPDVLARVADLLQVEGILVQVGAQQGATGLPTIVAYSLFARACMLWDALHAVRSQRRTT